MLRGQATAASEEVSEPPDSWVGIHRASGSRGRCTAGVGHIPGPQLLLSPGVTASLGCEQTWAGTVSCCTR